VAVGTPVQSDDPNAAWLWGMINRVFPLKLAARTCADMVGNGPVLLQSLHAEFAERGRSVGDLLTAADHSQGRRRNEALAVAFPTSTVEQKALVRFAHQFVGRRSSDGRYLGGAFETGLIGVVEPGSDWVAPTAIGWEFAKIRNHVLDDGTTTGRNLNEAEGTYYMNTVAASVPAERNAFRAILGVLAIVESINASSLASELRHCQNAGQSETVWVSTRSGALARLADVGAIARTAEGRSASYRITEMGRLAMGHLGGGDQPK
jgi:hypothetical protein